MLEREDAGLSGRSSEYPQPLLRLIVMLVQMEKFWAAQSEPGDFFEEMFANALSVLKLLENDYSEVDAIRNLLDPDAFADLKQETDAIFDRLEAFEATSYHHAFGGEGLWPPGSYG